MAMDGGNGRRSVDDGGGGSGQQTRRRRAGRPARPAHGSRRGVLRRCKRVESGGLWLQP